ncbi:MAG: hypothetical protein M3340_01720 [Actinomycetota bacterium]|nr:hypothetical protein [Actinomycetota bacterium]
MTLTRRELFIYGGGALGLAAATGQIDYVANLIEGEDPPDAHALLVDVTSSAEADRWKWHADMAAFASQAVFAKGPLYAAAWDGSPLPPKGWRIHEDYADDGGTPQSSSTKKRVAEGDAAAMKTLLEPLLREPTMVGGSPLLSALRAVAMLRASDPRRSERKLRAGMATDGVIMGRGLRPAAHQQRDGRGGRARVEAAARSARRNPALLLRHRYRGRPAS